MSLLGKLALLVVHQVDRGDQGEGDQEHGEYQPGGGRARGLSQEGEGRLT